MNSFFLVCFYYLAFGTLVFMIANKVWFKRGPKNIWWTITKTKTLGNYISHFILWCFWPATLILLWVAHAYTEEKTANKRRL